MVCFKQVQCQNDGKTICEKDEPDAPADKTDSEPTSKEDIDSHQTNNMLMSSEVSYALLSGTPQLFAFALLFLIFNSVTLQNEEPRKGDNLENKTLDIGAREDKAVHSLVRLLNFFECLYINPVLYTFEDTG